MRRRNSGAAARIPSTLRRYAAIVLLCAAVSSPAPAQLRAKLRVDPEKTVQQIDPRIYGQYLEHFGRMVQGGLWAELLRNRKFHPIDVNRSQVASPWEAEPDRKAVTYVVDRSEVMVGLASQRVAPFGDSTAWRGIRQTGFDVQQAREYIAYAWIKTSEEHQQVSFRLESNSGAVAAHGESEIQAGDWRKYEVRLTPDRDLHPAVFRIAFNRSGAKWIGAASLMPSDNVDGMRRDVLALIQAMAPPIIRWPGGGYTDSYDWRKAIGPRDLRPPQDLLPFGQPYGYDNGIDQSDFGTDEFFRFCERIHAEPYISANFGSGTPEMAAAWVEYANGAPSTPWGAKRAANGRAQPFGVKNWSIGNEIWAEFQPGYTTAEGYRTYLGPIAAAMRAADPTIQITAVGKFDGGGVEAWNQEIVQRATKQVDFLSLHHYYPGGFYSAELKTDPVKLYKAIVGEPTIAEAALREVISQVDAIEGGEKIRMAFDEWSEWHWEYEQPVETARRSWVNQFIDLVNKSGLEINQTMRDALFNARILHMLMRVSERVPIGIRTHMINSLPAIRTDSTRAHLTVPGLTMQLYRTQSGSRLVNTQVDSPTFDVPSEGWKNIPLLDAAATVSADGTRLFLHLINLHHEQALDLDIEVAGWKLQQQGVSRKIAPQDFLSVNDFGKMTVAIETTEIAGIGSEFAVSLPPHSITVLELRRAGLDSRSGK